MVWEVDCDLEGVIIVRGGGAVKNDVDVVLAEVNDGDAARSVEAPLWWDGYCLVLGGGQSGSW